MSVRDRRFRRPRGFTLFEVVVVILVVGVIVAMAAAVTRGISAAQRRSLTTTRIATVDAALVSFVAQQKRLPCPADGTLDTTHANAGIEGARTAAAGCTGNQAGGVVPWRALALTENEITDGWFRRLTYRVQPGLAADSGMDMSWCDPAGSAGAIGAGAACNPACTNAVLTVSCTAPYNFLNGKGLEVRNVTGIVQMSTAAAVATAHTGAAYVLISHGETGGGGYTSNGQLAPTTSSDGTEEAKNYANLAYTAGVTYYVDDSTNDTAGVSHFDDVVSRPALLTVIMKAGLGPRSH